MKYFFKKRKHAKMIFEYLYFLYKILADNIGD